MNASPTESSLAARFAAAIASGMQSDAHLACRGRHLRTHCMVEIGTTQFLLRVENGRIVDCRSPLPLMSTWNFAIRGTARAWELLWRDPPLPGWHDLFALSKRGEMRFEGDLHPFLANLQYFKDVLALPRAGASA